MRLTNAIPALAVLLLAGCNDFVEVPNGPPGTVVRADYVVIRPVTTEDNPGAKGVTMEGRTVYFHPSERIIDLRHLDTRTARAAEMLGRPGQYVVWVHTNPAGNRLLGAWTSANVEKRVGVFVDDRLIATPVVKAAISDMIALDGGFTKAQAEAIVNRLRRGGAA